MNITEFIICDDIRFEAGHKVSLMGLYSGEIVFSEDQKDKWPINFRFSCFIRLENNIGPGQYQFKLASMYDDENLFEASGDITPNEVSKSITIPLVGVFIKIPGPGIIDFNFTLTSDEQAIIQETKQMEVKIQQ